MTTKRDYTARVAYAIENGNVSRIIRWDFAKCEQVAREAVANTNGTLKEIRAYLNARRIAHAL